MASDDNFDITNPMLTVQDPEGSSAAKTPPSHGSGGAAESGASLPSSSPRQQEQVQSLKDPLEVVVDDPLQPEDDFIAKTKNSDVREFDITSVASVSAGIAAPTVATDGSGGGDGRGAPRTWSLTEKEHVRKFKKIWRRAFRSHDRSCGGELPEMFSSPWVPTVVAELRADPYLAISRIIKIIETEEGTLFALKEASPLHFAVLMGDDQLVKEILETCSVPNKVDIDSCIISRIQGFSALDLAIVGGESDIVDALLKKIAKVNTRESSGSLHLAVRHARRREKDKFSKIIQSLVHKGIDLNRKNHGHSPLCLAMESRKTDIVLELLKWKDKIHLNEKGGLAQPPIQFAKENGLKIIESELMKCEEVKGYIEAAFRDRQAYVDAANAILVGAALIASVTFASWLQPPLNYTTSYHGSSLEYVDVEHNIALGSFWVFNTLSFYFAIGTVVFGAHSVLPRRQLFITENVKNLSQNLFVTTILLAFSVFFVIVAFGIAGIIVLIPILRYRSYMIVPMVLGGVVCIGSIGYLFKSLWENIPWMKEDKETLKEISLYESDESDESDSE